VLERIVRAVVPRVQQFLPLESHDVIRGVLPGDVLGADLPGAEHLLVQARQSALDAEDDGRHIKAVQ
jgi:hypothetical protein